MALGIGGHAKWNQAACSALAQRMPLHLRIAVDGQHQHQRFTGICTAAEVALLAVVHPAGGAGRVDAVLPALAICLQLAGNLAWQVIKAVLRQLRVFGGHSEEARHLLMAQLPGLAGGGELLAGRLRIIQQACRRGAQYLQCVRRLSG